MDGVIVDTEPLHKKAYFQMFDEVGITVSQSLYNSYTGQSTITICRDLCDRYSLSEAPETLVAKKRKHFKQLFDTDTSLQLLPGVLELIKNYKKNDLTLVLASSASMPNIERIFERFQLNPYFKGKVSGADLKQSKPHPEIFQKAAAIAGANRSQCMVIEDATNGIKAAKAAGIYCVAYKSTHSKNPEYTLADKVISDFSEIEFEKISTEFTS